ncbi:MAG: 4-alpha-glucanotransferase [Pseudomonadota bacterium]
MSETHARRAGVCLHITSLPGPGGVGTLGERAYWFVDRLCEAGLSLWQVLPTGPTGYGDSPYQLLSVFAGNPMMIDLPRLETLGLITRQELDALPPGVDERVDFGALHAPRRALLTRAARRFLDDADRDTRTRFDAFCRAHAERWLAGYAEYAVLKSAHDGQPWYDWPKALANRSPAAMAAVRESRADDIANVKAIQFLFHEQWSALADYARQRDVKLIGDVPIYVAHDSADTWSRRDLLQFDDNDELAAVGGVPPDYFSADGQLWGNPLYDWDAHARTDFRWWRDRLTHACTLTDLVRIDHFRGFEAYWSVAPDAPTARDGHWVPGPGDALFDALTAHRPDLPIIAEDLGLITPPVQALRRKYALPGMAVLQFMVMEDGFHPSHIEEDRVCYTGTHDNDTTRGWFGEGDEPHDADRRARVLAVTGGTADNVTTQP